MTNLCLKNKSFFLLLGLTLFSLFSCKTHKEMPNEVKTEMNFIKTADIDYVRSLAVKQDKLIFIDFYADWCLPCKMMDEEVFSDNDVQEYLNKHFISVKVEADKGAGYQLATRYLVEGYPTLLFLDQDGKELTRKLGAAFHRELYGLGDDAISISQN